MAMFNSYVKLPALVFKGCMAANQDQPAQQLAHAEMAMVKQA